MKNNYLLPLISDVIKNIGTKKIFMKIDLRWGYNNMRMKEKDEWKTAFTTPEGSFEHTVMFFGLMNLLATFQTMINELLRDLINIGKIRSFIDDIMVGMETEDVVATTSQKTNNNTSHKSQGKYQVEIIRELNKEFLLYSYTIYLKSSWSVLAINSPTLMSMCNPYFYHMLTLYLL